MVLFPGSSPANKKLERHPPTHDLLFTSFRGFWFVCAGCARLCPTVIDGMLAGLAIPVRSILLTVLKREIFAWGSGVKMLIPQKYPWSQAPFKGARQKSFNRPSKITILIRSHPAACSIRDTSVVALTLGFLMWLEYGGFWYYVLPLSQLNSMLAYSFDN